MEGPRSPKPEEFQDVVQFLDKSLRPENNWSIANEYPTAINPKNLHNIRIITEQNKVLSHAVMKPLIIRSATSIFKVAAIGSVVTDSQYRNQGLSKKVLMNCLDEAKNQECDFAILWTDLFDFYRKIGFELAGSEVSALIDRELPAVETQLNFLETNKVSAEAIYKLYAKHTVHTVRTIDEVRKFLQIPNTKVYTAWEKNGELAAFAIEGKGADLNGYIHEWGGGVSKLFALFNFIRKSKKQSFHLIAPAHSQNLITQLNKAGIAIHHGFLGMIKIIQFDQLFDKINRATKCMGHHDFHISRKEDSFIITVGQESFNFQDEKLLTQLLFGPELPSEIFQSRESIFTDKLNNIFPLNLWIWGWDSI